MKSDNFELLLSQRRLLGVLSGHRLSGKMTLEEVMSSYMALYPDVYENGERYPSTNIAEIEKDLVHLMALGLATIGDFSPKKKNDIYFLTDEGKSLMASFKRKK